MTGSGGSIQWNLYVRVGDRLVAQRIDYTPPGGGASSIAMRYFTTDHLGSVAVITDELGAVVERLSFDAWGKRRHPDGADDPSGSITSQTTRGFTGHEMIDEVGLVNMNGRVYDPQIGRFMSADPFVQDPTNSQSLNRYTYVANNPLSYTDPSGYFLKEIGKALKSIAKFIAKAVQSVLSNPRALFSVAVGAALFFALGPAGLGLDSVLAAGISGGVSGYVATGTLKGAIIGAGTALAFAGVHHLKAEWGITGKTLGDQVASAGMHGAVGCASAAAGGGSCASGFLSAGVANFAGPKISPLFSDSYHGQLLAHATVGGIAAELGGGKFANGFVTAAFGYMFNEALSAQARIQRTIRVTAAFTNIGSLGDLCLPRSCAHVGIRIYAGDQLIFSVDGTPNAALAILGAEFGRAYQSHYPELELLPPASMSVDKFAYEIIKASLSYCNCMAYSFPVGFFSNYMIPLPGWNNSNSLTEGILLQASGGASYAGAIESYLGKFGATAPGINHPVPAFGF